MQNGVTVIASAISFFLILLVGGFLLSATGHFDSASLFILAIVSLTVSGGAATLASRLSNS